MLPKKHRLSKSVDVKQTTARGRSFFNPFFVLKAIKSSEVPRITVIVSTKVSKKAVVRNRLKRVVRNVVTQNLSSFPTGYFAFIIKPKAVAIDSKQFGNEVLNALLVSNILKP